MLGIEDAFPAIQSGHIVTSREHRCGEFKDDFDWSSLSLPYRKKVGALASVRNPGQPTNCGGET